MKVKLFRWRAIVPLCLLLGLILGAWLLYADKMVERAVEDFGAQLVGARVDLESADLRLTEGSVRLTGLQVANPQSPMRNLLEADEIVADIRLEPLLRKKIHIQQASFLGMKFGTERTTSGALDDPSPESGRLLRQISEWADGVRIPPLGLEALRAVVNVDAISPDSLKTIAQARATVSLADSARRTWETELSRLNPRPLVDSARALTTRLRALNPVQLGLGGGMQLVNSARTTLNDLTSTRDRMTLLQNDVRTGVAGLAESVRGLAAARNDDYRYARGLLRLPSLDAPDVSRSIFGDMAVERMKPLMYWIGQTGRFLPPGLDPRRYPGPKRPRRQGVTVLFPEPQGEPKFLLELAELGLEIGGQGAAAGQYAGRITGLTSAPKIYGRPMAANLSRTGGRAGPESAGVTALIDHTGETVRDSAAVFLDRLPLPRINLPALGAEVALNRGSTNLTISRIGSEIRGRWTWASDSVTWTRRDAAGAGDSSASTTRGIEQLGRDLLWRTVSSLGQVQIELRFSGSVGAPRLEVGSNVGGALARAMREQLGAEIERAQREVYARVDQLVNQYVSEASARADALQTEVEQRIGIQLDEITGVRAELEATLRRLVPRP